MEDNKAEAGTQKKEKFGSDCEIYNLAKELRQLGQIAKESQEEVK
jgi:hypothetical protein